MKLKHILNAQNKKIQDSKFPRGAGVPQNQLAFFQNLQKLGRMVGGNPKDLYIIKFGITKQNLGRI